MHVLRYRQCIEGRCVGGGVKVRQTMLTTGDGEFNHQIHCTCE